MGSVRPRFLSVGTIAPTVDYLGGILFFFSEERNRDLAATRPGGEGLVGYGVNRVNRGLQALCAEKGRPSCGSVVERVKARL